ncbi:MAG: DUF815 domain-containing protein [Lachnospiraceae bacterium]|nr:DUF815 domain-containing protein [Lachnospiraceae bacterium]
MYKLLSKLVIYKNIPRDSILYCLAHIIKCYEDGSADAEDAVNDIYVQIHRLLDVATEYGFNGNLWQNYLAFLIAMTETPFGLVSEKREKIAGSVNVFAKSDFEIFKELFDYDFKPIEKELGIDCFDIVTNYIAVEKDKKYYNRSVSNSVKKLSEDIAAAPTAEEILSVVTGFYRENGLGLIGLNKAFRLVTEGEKYELVPITNTEEVRLTNIIGYDSQKQKLIENTEAFVKGKKANNVLLYGDAGTGKSTSIKAVLNEYYKDGLRMIELYKQQFSYLPALISKLKVRNYRFIIYMDDLSFEDFETEYKYLKAVIEGGLEIRPENILIYATSNRRHLIKESWSDRNDMDDELHRSDTMQEKLSLVARFGVTIGYFSPAKQQYLDIVKGIAARHKEITLSEEELFAGAQKWELSHGGPSGRTAEQFVIHLLDTIKENDEETR